VANVHADAQLLLVEPSRYILVAQRKRAVEDRTKRSVWPKSKERVGFQTAL
jgi:hypothetical protein